jgi:hypothetical protein
MKILADLHHFDLYYSFHLLFEKRLGHTLYRPIGPEWSNSGFWKLSEIPIVRDGFLSPISGKAKSLLKPYQEEAILDPSWARYGIELSRVGEIFSIENGIYSIQDRSKNSFSQRGITFQAARRLGFDAIISSVPQHFYTFEEYRNQYHPKAFHIMHMGPGNLEWQLPSFAKNVMLHSLPTSYSLPKDLNYVLYHQEFDLDTFSYSSPSSSRKIFSYVHFPESEKLWSSIGLNVDFQFIGKTLGPLKDVIVSSKDLSQKIKESSFTWHIKPGGESYGHILHNSLACGRPLIINLDDFKNCKTIELLIDGETCLNTNCKIESLRDKIEHFLIPKFHQKMCLYCYEKFCSIVDFEKDAQLVEDFLKERLL